MNKPLATVQGLSCGHLLQINTKSHKLRLHNELDKKYGQIIQVSSENSSCAYLKVMSNDSVYNITLEPKYLVGIPVNKETIQLLGFKPWGDNSYVKFIKIGTNSPLKQIPIQLKFNRSSVDLEMKLINGICMKDVKDVKYIHTLQSLIWTLNPTVEF